MLARPWLLGIRVPDDGSVLRALGFAWLVCAANALLRSATEQLGAGVQSSALQQFLSTPEGPRLVFALQGLFDPFALPVQGPLAAALGLAATVALTPVRLICASALMHLALRLLVSSMGQDYRRTLRLVAYASAPAVGAWIPWVGYVFALAAWLLPMVVVVTDAVERPRRAP